MRVTIKIDDQLFGEVKRLAAERRQTMASLIEEALRQAVGSPVRQVRRVPVDLPESKERPGLCAGVDLDNSASLLDLMEFGPDSNGR